MGKNAPSADPRIADAAMKSAQTGQDYLDFMKGQAATTTQWATEDRDRYKTVFQPLQDQYIADAASYASPDRVAARSNAAEAGVQSQIAAQTGATNRSMEAMGVNPNSGRFQGTNTTMGMQGALAAAGAGNTEARQVRAEGQQMQAGAINMGMGLPAQAGQSMGQSNAAASSGFNGAMNGIGQQIQGLNTYQQQQMNSWQASQGAWGDLMGGVGQVAGMAAGAGAFGPALAFLSDKGAKEKIKAPAKSSLRVISGMPISEWTYKKGQGDGGRHIGPMAQDFQKATGRGTGRTIAVVDAVGVALHGIQELNTKVDKLAAQIAASKGRARTVAAPMRLAA